MTQFPFEDPAEKFPETFSDFDVFWAIYPRKVGKRKAREAFAKAVKRAHPAMIQSGIALYIRNKPAYCDWMHPTTFLNGDHWEDEYDAPKRQPHTPEQLQTVARYVKARFYERGAVKPETLAKCVEAGWLTAEEVEEKS